MSIHKEKSPLAGQKVKIKNDSKSIGGMIYQVEDWWDRVAGKSWMICDGNAACLDYAMRSLELPVDNEVLYRKINGLGKLVHITEIEVNTL